MIVTPYREDPFLSLRNVRTFDEFFAIVRAEFNTTIHAKSVAVRSVGVRSPQQFLSLSIPLQGIDPLHALQDIVHDQHDYFYWENGQTGEAIAAFGCAAQIQLSGGDRFEQAKQYVNQLFENILPIGNLSDSLARPRVFCRFTFFDQISPDSPFPPASLVLPQGHIAARGASANFVANIPLPAQATPSFKDSDAFRVICSDVWALLTRVRLAGVRRAHGYLRRLDRSPHNGMSRKGIAPSARLTTTRRFGKMVASLPHLSEPACTQFRQSVQAILDAIESTPLNKAVLAHALDVQLDVPLNGIAALHTLRRIHSDCYLFSTQNGNGQTFLCASPEKLLSIQDGHLTTEAIAGSAPRGKTLTEDAHYANRLLHNVKELYEHQLVVDFISHQLESLGLNVQRSPFPCLLPLSNIQHLQTPVFAKLKPTLHPFDVVAALHPTPAVAGVPRDLACEFIRCYEPFERSLYAAPMGWLDYKGDSEFLVGIRSALLDGHRARLYAGAGIVQGSDPMRELDEVELKLRTLYSALIQPC